MFTSRSNELGGGPGGGLGGGGPGGGFGPGTRGLCGSGWVCSEDVAVKRIRPHDTSE